MGNSADDLEAKIRKIEEITCKRIDLEKIRDALEMEKRDVVKALLRLGHNPQDTKWGKVRPKY